MEEICKNCGRVLDTNSVYYDFIHYRADKQPDKVPCIVLPASWLSARWFKNEESS